MRPLESGGPDEAVLKLRDLNIAEVAQYERLDSREEDIVPRLPIRLDSKKRGIL